MIRCDALVAGAGPAGSIAALELSRAGLRVVVADRMDQSTPKIGESLPGVGLRLLRSLRVDVSEFGTAHRKIGGNMTCWGAEELEATDFIADPDGPGWRLSRHRFDSQLLAAARQAGALHSAFHVDLVARQSETWECRTSPGESITARWLIDATGRSSHIARRLGVQRVRDEGLVALCGFSLIHPDPPSDRTLIEAVREGWWYGATLPDKTPLLVWHVRPQDARAARQDWVQALSRTLFVKALAPYSQFSTQMLVAEAGGSRLSAFHGEHWIACGDAAMSFDPLSSQGIYTAMYSGLIAARAIVATEKHDSSALANYASRLESIRTAYRTRLASTYAQVRRWKDAPFWASRRAADRAAS
jgi:flavin-dependent dehydrogenase